LTEVISEKAAVRAQLALFVDVTRAVLFPQPFNFNWKSTNSCFSTNSTRHC